MTTSSSFSKVSVIVPARNEASCIAQTVRAVVEQSTAACAVEVIVVDDASTDDTVRIARDAGAHVIEIAGSGGNPAAARNQGAAAAQGDPLIFLDADCQVADGWLNAFLDAHGAGETIVAGSLDLPEGLSFTAQCDYYCGWYLAHPGRPAGYVPHAPAPNLSVRRNAFFASSRFEEISYSDGNEERLWQSELRDKGHRFYFEPRHRMPTARSDKTTWSCGQIYLYYPILCPAKIICKISQDSSIYDVPFRSFRKLETKQ